MRGELLAQRLQSVEVVILRVEPIASNVRDRAEQLIDLLGIGPHWLKAALWVELSDEPNCGDAHTIDGQSAGCLERFHAMPKLTLGGALVGMR